MGAQSAWIFERGNAARLIDIGTRGIASIDVGDPEGTILPRIKIGIENAVIVAELEFQTRAFANLQRRLSKMTDEVLCGEAGEMRNLPHRRRLDGDGLRLDWGLLRLGGAAGEKQSSGDHEAAHQ